MDNQRKLEEMFARFPGIGPRQAKRFVHYIQSRSSTTINDLIRLIEEVRKTTTECAWCHRFFIRNDKSTDSLCNICSDSGRSRNMLMVVARDSDLDSIEKSGAYKGIYFVLGGTVPILDKEPEKRIRLSSLLSHLREGSIRYKEIILSLNTTPDGENTEDIVKKAISTAVDMNSVQLTVLGRGLSTGAELEYVDGETIRNALGNRK